jgi:hypothetical protein
LLWDQGKPRKTLIELAGRRTFRMQLTSSQQSSIKSANPNTFRLQTCSSATTPPQKTHLQLFATEKTCPPSRCPAMIDTHSADQKTADGLRQHSDSWFWVPQQCNGPWRLIGLKEVEDPTFSNSWLTDGGKFLSDTHWPRSTPQK